MGQGQGRGSAFGKVILLGEHAVVYGVPALAVALSQKVTAVAVPGPGGRVHLSVPAWGLEADTQGEGPDSEALRALLAHLGPWAGGATVVVEPEIPAGVGLGASAALAVATARALADRVGRTLSDEEASAAAFAAEKIFHGNPSGLDNAMAAYGGVRCFVRGGALEAVRVGRPLTLVVGDTGRPGATRETVAAVARLYAGRRAEVEECFAAIGELVREGRAALERGDLEPLGACMSENQRRLQWLGVSTPRLDRLADLAVLAGALGVKLTGGGGGGCLIALAPGAEAAVEATWARAGCAAFVTEIRATGLPVVGA
jgi:mevalonate kinase